MLLFAVLAIDYKSITNEPEGAAVRWLRCQMLKVESSSILNIPSRDNVRSARIVFPKIALLIRQLLSRLASEEQ